MRRRKRRTRSPRGIVALPNKALSTSVQHTSGDPDRQPTPFLGSREARDKSAAKKVARENPEAIAEAIAEAPPAAQRKIADSIAASPTVEPSLSKAVKPERKPRPSKASEHKLGEAVFALWEVGEMLMDQAPDGESKVRMTALAEKAERLSVGIVQLLGTGQLDFFMPEHRPGDDPLHPAGLDGALRIAWG